MMNGLVLSLKQNDYIEASRLVGQKNWKVLFKHLLPNTFPSLIVLFTINLGNAMMTESSLSYLGVGISPPTATWGNMVNEAYAYLMKAPRLAIIPGICIIALIVFGINMLMRVTGIHPKANYFFSVETEGNFLLEIFHKWIPVPFLYLLPSYLILVPYMLIITLGFFIADKMKNVKRTSR